MRVREGIDWTRKNGEERRGRKRKNNGEEDFEGMRREGRGRTRKKEGEEGRGKAKKG